MILSEFDCMSKNQYLHPFFHEVPPLFWIAHIFGWVFFFFPGFSYDSCSISIFVAICLISSDDIDDDFSWEFFVASGFGYLGLIGGSLDICGEEFFLFIFSLRSQIGTCHPVEIGARLELLHRIESDQVDQIQTHRDEGDQDVVKTRVQDEG